jgi:hypothetical protein
MGDEVGMFREGSDLLNRNGLKDIGTPAGPVQTSLGKSGEAYALVWSKSGRLRVSEPSDGHKQSCLSVSFRLLANAPARRAP